MKLSTRQISLAVLVFILLQPLLDLLAYWLVQLGVPNIVPILRLVLFSVVVILGYVVSREQKLFLAVIGGIGGFYVARGAALFFGGNMGSVTSDAAYYIRLVAPIMVLLALISLLRAGGAKARDAMLLACFINLLMVGLIVGLSYVTGIVNYSYESTQLGMVGWFSSDNGQGMVLVALTLMALSYGFFKESAAIVAAASLLGFVLLFVHGSRVAFFSIFAITAIWIGALIVTKTRHWMLYVPVVVGSALVFIFYSTSPMHLNTSEMQRNSEKAAERIQKEKEVSRSVSKDSSRQGQDTEGVLGGSNSSQEKKIEKTESESLYEKFIPSIVHRFGVESVAGGLNHTKDIGTLRDYRVQKNLYARLSIKERGLIESLFGQEYASFMYNNTNHEPENDLLAIPYLYGIVGAVLYWGALIGLIVYSGVHSMRLRHRDVASIVALMTTLLLVFAGLVGGHVALRTSVAVYAVIGLSFAFPVANSRVMKSRKGGLSIR